MKKTAIVTGSSRGIGFAIARQLGLDGYNIVMVATGPQEKNQAAVDALQKQGVCCAYVQANIGDHDDRLRILDAALTAFGRVDALVNNAGVAGQALFQDITDELWHRYFSVNVDGAYHAIQAVLPAMLHHHEGCIINTSSIWGLRGASCEVTYSCTKAALIGLTRSLAAELAPTHIRVNCVAPGVIRTDMLDALPAEVLPQLAQETPMGRLGTPEDIAHAVAFLASDKADFITGQVLGVNGGFLI